MLFSVVIPVYQAEKYIKRAIDSVMEQTCTDYELILVDNGSTDGSTEIIKGYIGSHPDMRIRYIRLDDNQGISGGRNAGIVIAEGEFISLLDADDYWYAKKLEKTAEVIRLNPDIDVFWHLEDQISDKETRISKFRPIDNHNAYRDLLFNGDSISPSTVSVRRTAILSVKGFDMKLDKGQEDYDCWLRMARNGAKFMLIQEPLGVWIIRKDSLSAKHELISLQFLLYALSS